MLCSRSCTLTCTCSLFIDISFGGGGLACGGRARGHHAAVLREVRDQPVHVLEVSAIDDEATVLAAARQPCARQAGEMERKRSGRKIELLADRAGSKPSRARFYKEPEDREPRVLREGTERLDGLFRFHVSRIMETLGVRQAAFSACYPAAALRTAAAIEFAADSITSLGSPSTITRSTGSVPEGRNRTRPRPFIECSASACASAIARCFCQSNPRGTFTLTSTCGNIVRSDVSSASVWPVERSADKT